MHQHDIRPTTEDIAATDEPRDEADPTTEMGRAEMGRAKTDRDELNRNELDRDETDRGDLGREDLTRAGTNRDEDLAYEDRDEDRDEDRFGATDRDGITEVDETARPTDTTLAGAHQSQRRENVTDVLFDEGEATRFQERWREVQAQFVDDPKQAVQDADVLVAELMQTLASAFSERKRLLEQQWREGSDTETEDLRLTLRGYRSFLDQLLTH